MNWKSMLKNIFASQILQKYYDMTWTLTKSKKKSKNILDTIKAENIQKLVSFERSCKYIDQLILNKVIPILSYGTNILEDRKVIKMNIKLKACCYCIDLRIGLIILAIIGFVINSGFIGMEPNLCWDVQQAGSSSVGCINAFYVLVAGSTIGIIGSLCLLLGAIMSNKVAISIYLVAEGMRMGLYLAFAILIFDLFGNASLEYGNCSTILGKTPSAPREFEEKIWCILLLVGGITGLLSEIISIYTWFCAFSFFQKIRAEKR